MSKLSARIFRRLARLRRANWRALKRAAALTAALAILAIQFPAQGFGEISDAGNANKNDSKKSSYSDGEASNAAMAPMEDPAEAPAWEVLDGIPQTNVPLGLPEREPVDGSYFDGTVFIGDSVTLKLQQYVTMQRKRDPSLLGSARFIAIGSLGVHSALASISKESLHPTIRGTKMTLEDALAALGAKKVYIMLGVNDVYLCGLEKSVKYMFELLSRIRAKLPDIEIFIESVTPRYGSGNPSTQLLFKYDLRLYEEIRARGDPKLHFVDVAYVMRNARGQLYAAYCSDRTGMGLHFTDTACKKWIEYLYTHPASADKK